MSIESILTPTEWTRVLAEHAICNAKISTVTGLLVPGPPTGGQQPKQDGSPGALAEPRLWVRDLIWRIVTTKASAGRTGSNVALRDGLMEAHNIAVVKLAQGSYGFHCEAVFWGRWQNGNGWVPGGA